MEEEGGGVGDELLFHPQLCSEPSKLIWGQFVRMLKDCSLQKKKERKFVPPQTRHSVRKLTSLPFSLPDFS